MWGLRRGARRYHHTGCDIEQCPRCSGQWISCGCPTLEEARNEDDSDRYVDVETAIEIISKQALKYSWHPSFDPLFMDAVAACGHVRRGHAWSMTRGGQPPVDLWFSLTDWKDGTAAILFSCRTLDWETVQEVELDAARAMADYAKDHDVLPWDLVYVTKHGNFRASDLLGLPGHPEFGPCTYDPNDATRTDW